ncbi:dihydrofolate reductase family protein [Priestia megaterium]|uniref:dihydrofolate reductase family protein n=1 Tax=Priestia megaterium TaxID=1404 RepID=UPI000BF8B7BF|nr:dihydrofolate reductase family protein [Priestia megaterium]MDP1427143.1 dihydrofolate reductase family protein [Priestia megaterium]MED4135571.1 dihydrofolate reductase family protein [Priestia megaterium]PEZ50155.1 deaminase [Priestia megaterium]
MAELIYHVAVSLDNFIADQGMIDGDINNSLFLFDGDHVPDFLSDIQQYNAVLMGGNTYEFGFQFGAKPGEPGYKGIKHYIFSNSIQFESNEEVELIKGNAIGFIKNLKQQESGKLWLCGGGELAGSLLKHKLIDQLVLKVNPIIVGEGIFLFGSVKPRFKLRLVDMKQYSNGVVKPTYNIIYT